MAAVIGGLIMAPVRWISSACTGSTEAASGMGDALCSRVTAVYQRPLSCCVIFSFLFLVVPGSCALGYAAANNSAACGSPSLQTWLYVDYAFLMLQFLSLLYMYRKFDAPYNLEAPDDKDFLSRLMRLICYDLVVAGYCVLLLLQFCWQIVGHAWHDRHGPDMALCPDQVLRMTYAVLVIVWVFMALGVITLVAVMREDWIAYVLCPRVLATPLLGRCVRVCCPFLVPDPNAPGRGLKQSAGGRPSQGGRPGSVGGPMNGASPRGSLPYYASQQQQQQQQMMGVGPMGPGGMGMGPMAGMPMGSPGGRPMGPAVVGSKRYPVVVGSTLQPADLVPQGIPPHQRGVSRVTLPGSPYGPMGGVPVNAPYAQAQPTYPMGLAAGVPMGSPSRQQPGGMGAPLGSPGFSAISHGYSGSYGGPGGYAGGGPQMQMQPGQQQQMPMSAQSRAYLPSGAAGAQYMQSGARQGSPTGY